MTITRDQLSNLTAVSPVSGTTATITFPTNPQAGSSVVVAIGVNFNAAGSISSVQDNGTSPSTFTLDVTKTGTANHVSLIYRADNITLPSSGGYVITITFSLTGVSVSAGAQSYLGKASGGPVSTNTGTATSGTITTNNGTPTVGGSLFVGTFQNNGSNTADNVTVTNANFTARLAESNGTTAQIYGFADQIKVANSADACTWSVATATDTYSSAIAVYSPAATGPAAPFTPPRQVVRGRPAARKGTVKGSAPFPPANPPAAPFQAPRGVVRGQKKATRGQDRDSLRLPKAFVPPPTPSPFFQPVRPVRGKPLTDNARFGNSLAFKKPVTFPQPAAPFTPPRGVIRGLRQPPKGRNTSARAPVAVAPPPVVSASGLVAAPIWDEFLVPTLSSIWTSFGTVTPGSSQLQVLATTSYSGITSAQQYDWTNTYALCKLAPYTGAASAQAFITLSAQSNFNQVDFGYSQGNLIVQTWLGGVQNVPFTVAYNATSHAWLRMRLDLQFIYFDTSPDGQVWTNRYQLDYVASHLVVWRMNASLAAGHFSAGTDGTAVFQYFNSNASIAGPVSIASVGGNSVFTPVNSIPAVGPRSVGAGNTDGNLLVVFATWNNQAVAFGVPMPTASVGDDQGNWWRFVGDSGQLASGGRTGVWICSNAMAVRDWLSFCPQGYCGSFAFQVVELQGLPASYYPNLDFHVAYGAGAFSLTHPSLSGVTNSADYVLLALGGQYTSGTVSGPTGSAWQSIGSVQSGGNDGAGDATCRLDTWWGAFAAGTSLSASWTVGGTFVGAASAVMVGITVNSALPAQSRPTYPRVVVDGGFGTLPGDPTLAVLDDQWQDMSPFCIGKRGETAITAQRGQQYELSQPEAGQLTIACNNQAGDFNPQWAGSQFYSNAINLDMSMQVVGVRNWTQQTGTGSFAMSSDFSFASASGCYANQSIKYVPTSTSTLAYEFQDDTGTDIVLNPNYAYTMSVWVYSPGGWGGGFDLKFVGRGPSGAVTYATTTVGTVAAGQWTQVTVTASPGMLESGTTILAYLDFNGSPGPANPFYLSEIALVPGPAPVQTGLVRLNVPVRVSTFWNGRRYPVGFGYVERWPQDWPDFPQWGWSKLIATDVVGVASSVNLPSAVQGEILVDQPYFCFPFNEQYAANSGSGNSGGAVAKAQLTGVDGMFAVNTSPVNQRPAVYVDGNAIPVTTGQSMGLLGDSGTGMGNSTDSNPNGTIANGPGAIYGPDFAVPVTNPPLGGNPWFTVEFWVNQNDVNPAVPATVNTRLLDIVCQTDLTNYSLGSGVLATIGVQYLLGNVSAELWVATNATPLTQIPFGEMHVNQISIDGSTFSVPGNLVTVTANGSTISVSLNGTFLGSWNYNNPISAPVSFAFGQAAQVTSQLYGTAAYSMAYATYYPLVMPGWRVHAHAQAGLTGFALDGVTDRALRYVAWSKLNLGLTGIQDSASLLGPAYSTSGASLANALNADCTSFGAKWWGNANGNLVVLSRQAQYNQSTPTVFGDAPSGVLNRNAGFSQGLANWTASGCAADIVNVVSFSGNSAARLTFSGSTNPTLINDAIPVTAGAWYEMTTWIQSPEGWGGGVSATVSWYNGATLIQTDALTAYPETAVWSPAILTRQAPATATSAKFGIQVNGTPPSGPSVLVDQAPVRLAFDHVPYKPDQGFDYDNTYVNNDIQAQMTEGPVTTSAPEVQDQTSIKKYFRRGPVSVQMSGTTAGSAYDLANWRLSLYKDPSMRVRAITCTPSSSPASFTRILQNDIADPVAMKRGPLNSTDYNLPVVTQRVEHTIGAGTWTTAYQLSPYTAQSGVLQADAPGFDVPANNSLAW